jgi:hypothetical protein
MQFEYSKQRNKRKDRNFALNAHEKIGASVNLGEFSVIV